MSGIYKIRCVKNGKEYIGSTKNRLEDRKADHWTDMKRGKHRNRLLQAAWDVYGEEAFEWEVLLECEEKDLLVEEDRLMREYGTMAPNGFNLKEAERQIMSEDTRRKMSESKMGEKNSFWGKKHSVETVEKIKERCKQLRHTEESKKKMREYWDTSKWSEERLLAFRNSRREAYEKKPEEEKKKMVEKWKASIESWTPEYREEVRKKRSEKATGRKHTEESKKKMSEKKKGHTHNDEAKEKMRQAAIEREAKRREKRKEQEVMGIDTKQTYSEDRKRAAREGLLRHNEEKRRAAEAALALEESFLRGDQLESTTGDVQVLNRTAPTEPILGDFEATESH